MPGPSDEVKQAVKEAIREDRDAFWVDAERHYQEHEFLRQFLRRLDTMTKASTWALGMAIASLIGSGVWLAIKAIVKKAGG